MIRIVATTAAGPLIILGLVETNLDRLRSGQPVRIDLGQMLVQGHGNGPERPGHLEGRLQLAIVYGTTHVGIIDDLRRARIPVEAQHREAARVLDEQLRDEGLL